MEIPEEQIKKLREQIISQINSTFPEDRKYSALDQINSMNNPEFIEFLKQNNLIGDDGSENNENPKCIFCSIISGEIPSVKIGENNEAIAVLEINPISKAHSLIIPKDHKPNNLKESEKLAKETAEKIRNVFSPKDIVIEQKELFGHTLIDVIPVYDAKTLTSSPKKANPKELNEIKKQLEEIKVHSKTPEESEIPKIETKTEITDKNTWLPKRFP